MSPLYDDSLLRSPLRPCEARPGLGKLSAGGLEKKHVTLQKIGSRVEGQLVAN